MLTLPTSEAAYIRVARWPEDEAVVHGLLSDYFQVLRDDPHMPAAIRAADRKDELSTLCERYRSDTRRAVLLAWSKAQACGCVALSFLPARTASVELKRLYVDPTARGKGVGRLLVQAAAAWAKASAADEILLDTVPAAMAGAVRLYGAAGFTPVARYNRNTGPEFAFYRLRLR